MSKISSDYFITKITKSNFYWLFLLIQSCIITSPVGFARLFLFATFFASFDLSNANSVIFCAAVDRHSANSLITAGINRELFASHRAVKHLIKNESSIYTLRSSRLNPLFRCERSIDSVIASYTPDLRQNSITQWLFFLYYTLDRLFIVIPILNQPIISMRENNFMREQKTMELLFSNRFHWNFKFYKNFYNKNNLKL